MIELGSINFTSSCIFLILSTFDVKRFLTFDVVSKRSVEMSYRLAKYFRRLGSKNQRGKMMFEEKGIIIYYRISFS